MDEDQQLPAPVMDQRDMIEENFENTGEEGSDEDEKSVSMIRPTLLRQLQTILSEYPDDAQILRSDDQHCTLKCFDEVIFSYKDKE